MRDLKHLVGQAVSDVLRRGDAGNSSDFAARSLVFLGNWQDPCPRQLILHRDLNPMAIVLWQLIRIHTDPGKPVLFPSYDFLTEMLRATKPTVASAITLLRLTRWLVLCAKVRDEKGRFRGQVFALCDHSLPVKQALVWDPDYLELVAASCGHRRPAVASVARSLLTRLEAEATGAMTPNAAAHHQVKKHRARQIELGTPVKIFNSDTLYTSCSSNSSSKGKAQKASAEFEFSSPLNLPPTQQHLIRLRLQDLDPECAQEVLDEAAGRIQLKRKTKDAVRSQFDYLTGLIRRAKEGDFVFSDAGESIRQGRYDAELAQWAKKRAMATMDQRRISRMNGDGVRNTDRSAEILDVSKKP